MSPQTIWLERVTSTQDVLHGLAAEGADDGTAVVAVEQSDGRGSRGRAWVSPRGGAWLSVLSRPATGVPGEALSLRVALAVTAALELLGITTCAIKWPNDLLVDDRKLGGILCEARWLGGQLGWIAIGVGLNVANAIPAALRPGSIALAERWPALRPGLVATAVIEKVRPAAERSGLLDREELAEFEARDWLRGRTLLAPVAGVGAGIEPDGALRVRRADGIIESVRVGPAVAATH
ncbi:MAG: biotin--[acetyl-CoA-carboxylase] ligase [Gemmatimonadales bacterium]|nr:biotin--[acetyl-CoA-carboxylase] ligase [Gemmatimonadales bacterium]